jgi:hypothetical protein
MWWLDSMGVLDRPVDRARIHRHPEPSLQIVGSGPDRHPREVDLHPCRPRGIRLGGRLVGLDGMHVELADDLAATAAAADAKLAQLAEKSAAMWEGTAWQAATLEARAHLSFAQGREQDAARFAQRGRRAVRGVQSAAGRRPVPRDPTWRRDADRLTSGRGTEAAPGSRDPSTAGALPLSCNVFGHPGLPSNTG